STNESSHRSMVDIASLDKRDAYTEAKRAMFVHTDAVDAPWTVITSDRKKRPQLNAISLRPAQTASHRQGDRPGRSLDPLLVGCAYDVYESL
ncbi:MAG: polyphosphate kinase, partial [Actinomycetota bacterium]|nr:polyphosphate kinase [Actinomycetota bacterium]